MKKSIVAGGCLALILACGIAARAEYATARWDALVDEYLDKVYFPLNPTTATQDGIHRYDSDIEDYSRVGAEAQAGQLRDFAARVEQFPAEGLPPVDAADRYILLGTIHSELLTLEKIRPAGDESRRLFQRRNRQHLRPDEPEVRTGG